MRPATVSLRTLHDQSNTRLDMYSEAAVPSAHAGEDKGEIQSVADHFSVLEGTSDSHANGVSGATLAKWRAQEVACQGLVMQGEARPPGVLAGRFLAVPEVQSQTHASQYYITQVEQDGRAT